MSQPAGTITGTPLTIGNTGTAALDWTIGEAPVVATEGGGPLAAVDAERQQLLRDGVLLVPNTALPGVAAFDPETGDLLDPAFITYPAEPGHHHAHHPQRRPGRLPGLLAEPERGPRVRPRRRVPGGVRADRRGQHVDHGQHPRDGDLAMGHAARHLGDRQQGGRVRRQRRAAWATSSSRERAASAGRGTCCSARPTCWSPPAAGTSTGTTTTARRCRSGRTRSTSRSSSTGRTTGTCCRPRSRARPGSGSSTRTGG